MLRTHVYTENWQQTAIELHIAIPEASEHMDYHIWSIRPITAIGSFWQSYHDKDTVSNRGEKAEKSYANLDSWFCWWQNVSTWIADERDTMRSSNCFTNFKVVHSSWVNMLTKLQKNSEVVLLSYGSLGQNIRNESARSKLDFRSTRDLQTTCTNDGTHN